MNFNAFTGIRHGRWLLPKFLPGIHSGFSGIDPAVKKRLMMRIKLTNILLIVTLIQASAKNVYSQVSLNEKNTSLDKVLRSIEKQTDYVFLYTARDIRNTKISIRVDNASVIESLDKCLEGLPFSYKVVDKNILIKKDEHPVIAKIADFFSLPDNIKGKVTDSLGNPLAGATIKVKGTSSVYMAGSGGEFEIKDLDENAVLVISYIGYKSKELAARSAANGPVVLKAEISGLNEVAIVSTGYQTVEKERATGSFNNVDNALFNRRVSTDLISRIADVVPGLIFNRNVSTQQNSISIRGQSTIFANKQPLIVLDNFPYEGDLLNINPNDVEQVTVLKDAAAASIWGARAGNGVIVITTKKGKFNQTPQVSFNSNFTSGNKPDQFYTSRISTSEFIDLEKMLFGLNYYKSAETASTNTPLSPVVELLIAKRDGKMAAAEADAAIEALKSQDVRNDFDRYLYRKSANLQSNLQIRGGSENQNYMVSAGFDRNLTNLVGNSYNRMTLNALNTYSLLGRKLDITTGIYYTQTNTVNNSESNIQFNNSSTYPYAKLADENDNPLALTRSLRLSFIQNAKQKGLLDWEYRPLEETELADNTLKLTDYRISASVKYRVLPFLSADVLYQYGKSNIDGRNRYSQSSYFTRNLINNYTQVNADGSLNRAIPLGNILDLRYGNIHTQNFRGQLNLTKQWKDKHALSAIAGGEIRDNRSLNNTYRLYGYDEEHAISTKVDYITVFPNYSGALNPASIPNNETEQDLTDRYLSYYANGTYTLNDKYIFSASARLDQSNLFGVKSNQKGVPLYSGGFKWVLSSETFYKVGQLPYLALKASYGYNGNVDQSASAYTTASYSATGGNLTKLPIASVVNPPNPELRWERVKIINSGVDFSSRKNRINGSIEYYHKIGLDLIGNTPYPSSTGILSFRGNTANTSGSGIDIELNIRTIDKAFKWSTNLIVSHIAEKVTHYQVKSTASNYISAGFNGSLPLEGKPLAAIYSYQWAGLDPKTGEAQGYLDGSVSKDYAKIIQASTPENMLYHGSAKPTWFGAVRNNLSWNQLSLSATINYRLGYYFRRNSVSYTTILSGRGGHGDYSSRWLKAGDELITQVPVMPASITVNANRENFYAYSEVLVERGDHIRLQDISLVYDFGRKNSSSLPFRHAQIYLYTSNLGMIWTLSKSGLDPDFLTSKQPVSLSAGLKLDL